MLTRQQFPVKDGDDTNKNKRQKCNDRHFVIIRLFRNLIALQTDVLGTGL